MRGRYRLGNEYIMFTKHGFDHALVFPVQQSFYYTSYLVLFIITIDHLKHHLLTYTQLTNQPTNQPITKRPHH
jgi:hypothetical protein